MPVAEVGHVTEAITLCRRVTELKIRTPSHAPTRLVPATDEFERVTLGETIRSRASPVQPADGCTSKASTMIDSPTIFMLPAVLRMAVVLDSGSLLQS